MKRILALALAFLYLGSYVLHGVAHAGDSKAESCASCAIGGARVVAAPAPVVESAVLTEDSVAPLSIPVESFGPALRLQARGPPAS